MEEKTYRLFKQKEWDAIARQKFDPETRIHLLGDGLDIELKGVSPHLHIHGKDSTVMVRGDGSPHIATVGSATADIHVFGSAEPVIKTRDASGPRIHLHQSSRAIVKTRNFSTPLIHIYESSVPLIKTRDSSRPVIKAHEASRPTIEAHDFSAPRIEIDRSSRPQIKIHDAAKPVILDGPSHRRVGLAPLRAARLSSDILIPRMNPERVPYQAAGGH